MEISLRGKNRKLTPAEEELIRKKVGRLPRYLDHLVEAEVIVGTEAARRGVEKQVVQLTVRANGTLLRAEERDPELQAALDLALDKVERRIERYKGRRQHAKKGRQPLGVAVAPPPALPDGEEEEEAPAGAPAQPIVRTKRFAVEPMSKEDAVEQMELLGHDFFVFWDSDTQNLGVLYRRQDGNYGVLEPQFGRD